MEGLLRHRLPGGDHRNENIMRTNVGTKLSRNYARTGAAAEATMVTIGAYGSPKPKDTPVGKECRRLTGLR